MPELNSALLPGSITSIVPQTIGSFKYVQTLTGVSSYERYTFAVYTNGLSNAIGKFWHKATGRKSGRAALCREIRNHKILADAALSLKKQSSTHVPAFYDSSITRDTVWMLTEYVHPLSSQSLNFSDYRVIREHLKQLGMQLMVRGAIGRRSNIRFVIGFVFVWLRIIVKGGLNSITARTLVKNFLLSVPLFFSTKDLELCHLDLRADNVLYSSTGKYIIDFQSTAYAAEALDLAFSLDRALLHNELSRECTADLLKYICGLSSGTRRLISVYFSYGLLCDLLFDAENSPAENYKYLKSITELIHCD